jgi:hypothetical protein
MLGVAVRTAHFPISAQPAQGKPAHERLRVLSGTCWMHVLDPHAGCPSQLRPRSGIYDLCDVPSGLLDVKTGSTGASTRAASTPLTRAVEHWQSGDGTEDPIAIQSVLIQTPNAHDIFPRDRKGTSKFRR